MSLLYSWQCDSFLDSVSNYSISAYNHFGIYSTTLPLAPGKVGLGYALGNGTRIDFPIGFGLTNSTNNISFWIYIKKSNWGTSQTIFYNSWDNSSTDSYKLEILNGHFVWNYFNGITRTAINIDSILPSDDTWFHIRFVYSSGGTQWLYINGVATTEINGLISAIQTPLYNYASFGNDLEDNYLIGDCVLDIINIYDDLTDDYNSGNGHERFISTFGGFLVRPTQAIASRDVNVFDSLNVSVSGEATVDLNNICTGGAIVSGVATNSSGLFGEGGAFCRGFARVQKVPAPFRILSDNHLDITYNESGIEGALVSGSAIINTNSSVPVTGGALIQGSASLGFETDGSGNIEISGSSSSKVTYSYRKTFSWKVNRTIVIKKDFSWNVGDIPLSWYRVEGKCTSDANCETNGFQLTNGCGYVTYIQVIAARGLDDLCSKLKEGKLFKPVIWPLKSITKRNNPVYKTDSDSSCDIFEEQDFCSIPECMDFCVDEIVYFKIDANYFIQDNFLVYEGSGNINLSGDAVFSTSGDSTSYFYSGSGSLSISGTSITASEAEYFIDSVGGARVSAEAIIVCPYYAYESLVETVVSGSALVTNSRYFHIGSGDLEINGSATFGIGLVGLGGLSIGGVGLSSLNLPHIASGNITLGGDALLVSQAHSYVGSGNFTLEGTASYSSTYAGTYIQDFSLDMFVDKIYLGFIEDSQTSNLTRDTTTVISCGCSDIPLTLSVSHNFNNENQLYRFIKRNKVSFPSSTYLNYKSSNNSWYYAYHFKGIGEQDNNLENWLINFNWNCSEAIDSVSEGGFWNLKINIRKENIETAEDVVTRMSFVMPINTFCRTNINKVKLKYNVKKKIVTTDINFAELDYFEDNIGLFKNKYWTNNPVLNLAISDELSTVLLPRYDYGKFFPKNINSVFS